MPSRCMAVSIGLAIGVPSGVFRCRLPWSLPLAWPKNTSGQRRWLCTFGSAIGEPHMIIDLSSRLLSPSMVFFILSRKYAICETRYLLILLKSMMLFSLLPWCDDGWNDLHRPLSRD